MSFVYAVILSFETRKGKVDQNWRDALESMNFWDIKQEYEMYELKFNYDLVSKGVMEIDVAELFFFITLTWNPYL